MCPACGRAAFYVKALDRYVHVDSSDNRPCWLRVVRGLPTDARPGERRR